MSDTILIDGMETYCEKTIHFPMRFSHIKTPKWIRGSYCPKCDQKLGDIIWMAHSTPEIRWETDYAFGEFCLCDACGLNYVLSEEKKYSITLGMEK